MSLLNFKNYIYTYTTYIYCVCMCVCMCVCVFRCISMVVCMRRSQNNFQKSILSQPVAQVLLLQT